MALSNSPPSYGSSLRPQYRKPLDDEAEAGMLDKLTGYSSSALQTGLHILDTPGSLVRGGLGRLVGARPKKGERTSGRDLTDALGITRRGAKGFWSHVPGFGVELLTDPLTYFTGGAKHALTTAGRAVSKTGTIGNWSRKAMLEGFHGVESSLATAGHTAEDIAHMRNQGLRIASPLQEAAATKAGVALKPNEPLGALAGFGAPFGKPSILIGKGGPLATKIAGGLDAVGDKLKFGNPIGRWANGMFDSRVREAVTPETQKAMMQYGTPTLEAGRMQARNDAHLVQSKIQRALDETGVNEEDLLRYSRQAAEDVPLREAGRVPTVLPPVPPELAARSTDIGLAARKPEARQLAEATRMGLPLSDANDPFVTYMPRGSVDLEAARQLAAGKTPRRGNGPQLIDRNNLPVVSGANFRRDDTWRGIPGGTTLIDDWVRRYAGIGSRKGRVGIAAKQMYQEMVQTHLHGGGFMDPDLEKQLAEKALKVAGRVVHLSPDYRKSGIGMYSPNITGDVARSGEQHARTMATGDAVMGFIGDNARRRSELGVDAVPISHVFKGLKPADRLGFVTRLSDPANKTPMEGALVEAYRRLAKQGAGPVDPFLMGKFKDLKKAADQYALPRKLYDDLVQTHGRWSMPEVLKEQGGLFNGITSAFKNLSYPLWPASHVRNALSAGLNNAMHGTGLKDYAAQLRLMRGHAKAVDLERAGLIPAGSRLTDEQARDLLRRQQFSTAKIGDGHAGQFDLDDAIAAKLQSKKPGRITPDLWGTGYTGTGNVVQDAGKLIGGSLIDQAKAILAKARHPISAPNPFDMAGVLGGKTDFPLLAAGRKVGSNIEDFFRGANWLGNVRQGMTPEAAGMATRNLHFDYDALTKFEKNVMRKAVPFYTFARKNLPLQASYLLHTPASSVAQMRAMSLGRSPSDYVPDYLSGGPAIPTGPEEDGKRQFISSFGLPIEEAMERFKFRGGLPDVRGTLYALAANMNPLIKAPVEQLFDTQFHTGRKLSDLRPPATASALGRLIGDDNPQLLAQILANSPLTRFVSGIDKSIDSRKTLAAKLANMATGVKVTDVDLGKTRAAEAAQVRNEILSRLPHVKGHTNYYVRPGEEKNLTPVEVELLRSQASSTKRGREYAESVKKRIGLSPRP